MTDVSVFARVVESSPVIVVLLVGILIVLWRAYEKAQSERIVEGVNAARAIEANTLAMQALAQAVDRAKREERV